MFRKFVTCTTVAVALIGANATRAMAQNPFAIDGLINDTSNSKATGGSGKKSVDPNGNAQELGPDQGKATKFFQIETAAVPMLSTTNPNPGSDFNVVYTETKKAANGDTWFYFGWNKDNATGSGFVSIEAHKEANSCVDGDGDGVYTSAELLACNPWSPRTNGDVAFFWDQSGNGSAVYLRTWDTSQNPDQFFPGQPGTLISTLGDTIVQIKYGNGPNANNPDRSKGEIAINMSGLGLITAGSCEGFANVIPMSITGNSSGDQADVKDAVLAPISINTCGKITVTKVTLDPAGKFVADTATSFKYTLKNTSTDPDTVLANAVGIKGCTKSDPDAAGCSGEVDTYEGDTVPPGDYSLQELLEADGDLPDHAPPYDKALSTVKCEGVSTAAGTLTKTFTVSDNEEVECIITNKQLKTTPSETTNPGARVFLNDSINITGIIATATPVANVTFQLFSDSSCTAGNEVGTGMVETLTYSSNGTVADASTLNDHSTAVQVFDFEAPGNQYWWKVTYAGDASNNAFATCGTGAIGTLESSTVTVTHVK